MKRHPALRELSSDHHQGLVHARRLLKAAGDTNGSHDGETELEGVARGFLAFWSEHTIRHFREEEEILLPAFARYGDPSLEPVVRVLVEHVQIRRLVNDLRQQVGNGEPSVETMRAIGEMLRGHIRHEENVLFPLIETVMPEEALAELPNLFVASDNHYS
jgi:hemerythrin-like domain-containing protein